jgi:hypothetical protein
MVLCGFWFFVLCSGVCECFFVVDVCFMVGLLLYCFLCLFGLESFGFGLAIGFACFGAGLFGARLWWC